MGKIFWYVLRKIWPKLSALYVDSLNNLFGGGFF